MKLGYECNQRWDKMQDTEGGKFCTLCNKTVHDMRDKTRDEILASTNLCGYYNGEQLDGENPPGRFNLRMALAGLATVFSLNASKSFAQSQPPQTEQHAADFSVAETGQPQVKSTTEIVPEVENTGPAAKYYKRRHSITLFRIGYRRVYLSPRFPFLHVRRMRMGMRGAW